MGFHKNILGEFSGDHPSGYASYLASGLQEEEGGDPIQITVDSLLKANYYKFMVENKKESGIPGFRIRIYSESGLGAKEKQQRVRARFLSMHPDIDAYYRYDEPFFKVYVGDCRTKRIKRAAKDHGRKLPALRLGL